MTLDYIVTIDNFPSLGNCSVVTTEQYCLASLIWQLNGKTEVYYDPSGIHSSFETVVVSVEREASEAGQYSGERSITYRCSSSDTPCNTPEKLKRVLAATTFPDDEQVNQLNTIIAVTPFDSTSCFIHPFNWTDYDPADFINCKRCLVIADYSTSQLCATCPKGSPNDINFFDHSTSYVLNNRTQWMDSITLECQAGRQCNSLTNVERIQKATINKFDFDKFFSSNAVTPKLMLATVIMTLLAFVAFN